jgi:hypothetical protein
VVSEQQKARGEGKTKYMVARRVLWRCIAARVKMEWMDRESGTWDGDVEMEVGYRQP